MWIIFVILFALLALILIIVQRGGGFGFPWLEFYIKGKESGFSFHEINLMRQVAVQNKMKNPSSLFWSERQLDRCIRGMVLKIRSEGKEREPQNAIFLDRLFQFRKRVEFNLPKYRLGLRSSRSINAGQILKITMPGSSVYLARVVENMRKYIAISYPKGKALPPGFSWQKRHVNIYFWRHEDAGYYFETKVIGDYLNDKFPILHVAHSDKLVRTQKRGSVRAELNCTGSLFPLKTINHANEVVETAGGYRCRIVDISEDGAAILVGGKAKPGMPIKLQFELDDNPVVMCGTVIGVSFKPKNSQSVLHIKAVEPSIQMKNRILTKVYNIFGDETDPANRQNKKK